MAAGGGGSGGRIALYAQSITIRGGTSDVTGGACAAAVASGVTSGVTANVNATAAVSSLCRGTLAAAPGTVFTDTVTSAATAVLLQPGRATAAVLY